MIPAYVCHYRMFKSDWTSEEKLRVSMPHRTKRKAALSARLVRRATGGYCRCVAIVEVMVAPYEVAL